MNMDAIDKTIENLVKVEYPADKWKSMLDVVVE